MSFHCRGIYTSKCARNQILKCWCYPCHISMSSIYLSHGIFCSYDLVMKILRDPVPSSLKKCYKSYLLSRTEWWCVTLTFPQALHLCIWGLTVGLVEGRGRRGGGQSLPQTGCQISLHLLNNQVTVDDIQVNISLIKLWTGTFSFLIQLNLLYLDWEWEAKLGHV